MNEIFKNLLITISNGGDNSGGGKLKSTNTALINNPEVSDSDYNKCGGGSGNDPIEEKSITKAKL